jgi:S-adenosylmethionine-diacylgycerolhomoserine-N-methlytransferase
MTGEFERHGALMDRVYHRQRFLYDLSRKYYLFGRDKLIRELSLSPGDRLVEVGCGTARNLIAIARRYPEISLFGLDASQTMLETARSAVSRAGLEGRITVCHGYAEQLTPALLGESTGFDHAMFSYSLSMIPDWKGALRAAAGCLVSTGRLHVVDFGDLESMGRLPRALLRSWLRRFHVEPRIELLGILERSAAGGDGSSQPLWVSPGRYAFAWSGSGGALQSAI